MNVERWGWYSIAVNVILAAINLVIAAVSGSLAVQAEMVHNLVDLLTAIAVLIGLKLSTLQNVQPPVPMVPSTFGHPNPASTLTFQTLQPKRLRQKWASE